jgi:hypothetical protein
MLWHIATFAAGFLILAGAKITAYLRLDDKISDMSKSQVRIETKLDDLIARLPPAPTPIPRK